jgi:peptide deformylase
MSILKVAKLGNPVLRDIARPVEIDRISSPEIQRLVRDMIETMREYEGVGLAAPQVHELLQIVVIEALSDHKKPEESAVPLTVLINPALTVLSEGLVEDWEGCLSIPCLRGMVPRYREISVQGYDLAGKLVEFPARDFQGRVIQHEYDHLMGKVFLDRMRSFESLSFSKEFAKYWQRS